MSDFDDVASTMMSQRMAAQNAEFKALDKLKTADDALKQTAVVDDDYPMVRHRYEQALREFLDACVANGRGVR